MSLDPALATEAFCYLTTTGRVTGRPHTIEIWFALVDSNLYLLAGGRNRADWVRNLRKQPAVTVKIGELTYDGIARVVDEPDEDQLARRLLLEKYAPGYGGDLSDWGRTALAVAIETITST